MNLFLSRLKIAVFALTGLLGLVVFGNAQSGRVQATPTPTPAEDMVRVYTEEIKLNVLAFDESGNFYRDVKGDDLVITENNILHQPSSVRRLPANVLIVMDTGGEMRSVKSLDKTRLVARGVVNGLRPDDSIALLQYSDKAEIAAEWTSDRSSMLAAIKRTKFGRRSAFVDALRLATDFMLRDPLENKHIVLITDGTDSGGRSSAKFDAYQRLLATNISVHVLSYTAMETADIEPRTKRMSTTPPPKAMPDEVRDQLPNDVKIAAERPKVGPTINMDRTLIKKMKSRKTDLEESERQLDQIAENTNGEYILADSVDEMIDKSALVARMIDSSYVVTYVPKVPIVETRGIAERNIEVTSRRSGLVVQARRRLVLDRSKN